MPRSARPLADTMPIVTVWPTPNGFPIASTTSPKRSREESPNSIGLSDEVSPSSLSSARSLFGSRPTAQGLASSLFERYLDSLRLQAGIPGLSALILQDGVISWERGFGRADIERSIEHIEHHLQTLGEREVPSRLVGDLVMEELRRLDEVAYVRFASVYRSFQDVTEFQQEIERLQSLPSLLESREQMSLLPEEEPTKKK